MLEELSSYDLSLSFHESLCRSVTVLEGKVQLCWISQICREESTCEVLIVPNIIGALIRGAAKVKG